MTEKRRTFTAEFKLEAIELSKASERTDRDVERDLDLPRGTLHRWRKELACDGAQAFPGKGHLKADDEALRQLRRENEVLRQERDILKKALGIFSQGPKP